MDFTITINYISIFDAICFATLVASSIGCYRLDGVFGRKFSILLAFLAIETLFAGVAIMLPRENIWYQIIKITGRCIEIGAIGWFLFYITEKVKKST